MPIQNIQGLVDKNGLHYIQNNEFIQQYYEEALANLGQRNTNDSLLESVTFTINDIFSSNSKLNDYLQTENPDPYLYVIYYFNSSQNNDGTFYTLNKSKIDEVYGESIEDEELQHIIIDLQSFNYGSQNSQNEETSYIKELKWPSIDNKDNDYILLKEKRDIISKLFNYINNPKDEYGEPLKDKNNNPIHPIRNNIIFIPLKYKFGYIGNAVNTSVIYHNFKDIYVNSVPAEFYNKEDDYNLDSSDFYFSNIFYFADNKYLKTDIYEYVFLYEGDNGNVEYHKKFTLPYVYQINEDNKDDKEEQYDNCWVINDVKTTIQAKVDDTVHLNIILAYYSKNNDNDPTYKYLSGLNCDKFKIDRIGTKDPATEFKIKNGEDIVQCALKTPSINTNALTKEDIKLNNVLQNSTLIIISKITDIIIDGNNFEKYGDGFVTTMWHYVYTDENDKVGHFECICIDDIALDFNQLTNFNNLLKYEIQHISQVTPDNYLYRHLIFDQIYQQLKQDNSQFLYAYPVLQNIKGSQYNNKYNNNMNFSLKYVNYISGEIGRDIKGVSKNSDIKYLKNNSNETNSSNIVTNALYQYIKNNKVNYYNEYIPNYNVPVFDTSEILIKDFNVLNKNNIITFDYDGTLYYSYIGTSYQTPKNVLTIGSSNLNINLGENTLTDYNTKKNFSIQDTINIDFSNINVNGNLNVANDINVNGNIIVNKFEWNESAVTGKVIRSTSFVPQFKYYSFNNDELGTQNIYKILELDSLEADVRQLRSICANNGLDYGSNEAKEYLYISPIIAVKQSSENQMPYYYKYNDLLVLPNLVKYLGFKDGEITNFESNTNDIITVGGTPLYLVSSNNILANSVSIVSSTDVGITIDTLNYKDYYLGNTLYVSYIPAERKLIINEVQSSKTKSIWKIPTEIN